MARGWVGVKRNLLSVNERPFAQRAVAVAMRQRRTAMQGRRQRHIIGRLRPTAAATAAIAQLPARQLSVHA